MINIKEISVVKPKVENESKEARFKRVASLRTQKTLDGLRLLGNCSNKSAYSYSQEDTSKIFSTIDKELRRVKGLFNKSKNNMFSL